EAEDSWWFLPNGKLNLGLDLQGGVYLLMEINPDEVVENQTRNFRPVLREATNEADPQIIYPPAEFIPGGLRVELRDPEQSDQFLALARRINPTVPTVGTFERTYNIRDAGGGAFELTVTDGARRALLVDAQGKTQKIARRRVDPDGVAEISVVPEGENRIALEAPGEADPQRLKELLRQGGRMTFNLVDPAGDVVAALRAGQARRGWLLITPEQSETGEPLIVREDPILTGADIITATQTYDENNRPNVTFRLNTSGGLKFGEATAANVGNRFAIILDGTVISAPRIISPIRGGSGQITGSFTINEASDLAAIIEAGELPAKIQFVQERTVGPGLGEDSIRAGTRASLIGLVLVAIFMVFIYRLYGALAVLSLAANVILLIGALSLMGATLTLPGIAGIILTIGMAVDANVLVFERIREEQRNGRSPLTAVQAGYERALSTILDANITTFIAAIVLYAGAGGGPVGGFAVTLAIGIFTSVFTAFVVTRWLTVMYLKSARPKRLAI
ncbi:MAG: protein translocase subunit SecD, partial [Pseudomonadota bacterium]